jgi:hypothetical protein
LPEPMGLYLSMWAQHWGAPPHGVEAPTVSNSRM